jgi:hypothetical protein
MTSIETHDSIGGDYMDENPGGVFGSRHGRDRRYWTAWTSADRLAPTDCHPGVMDDFGTLAPPPPKSTSSLVISASSVGVNPRGCCRPPRPSAISQEGANFFGH